MWPVCSVRRGSSSSRNSFIFGKERGQWADGLLHSVEWGRTSCGEVCVCVCKRRQELRWKTVGMSKVWADMTSAGVSFGPFLIASVSHSTSYWFNWIQRCAALCAYRCQITEIPASVLSSCCYSLPFSKAKAVFQRNLILECGQRSPFI